MFPRESSCPSSEFVPQYPGLGPHFSDCTDKEPGKCDDVDSEIESMLEFGLSAPNSQCIRRLAVGILRPVSRVL